MTREMFAQKLAELGLDASSVLVSDPVRDGFGIRKNYYRWEIFRRERGIEYNTRGFPSESDALRSLFEEITGKPV